MRWYTPFNPTSRGDPVSTRSATLPRSSSLRSPRATTELQKSQTTTIDEPILKFIGAPHPGQIASTGLTASLPHVSELLDQSVQAQRDYLDISGLSLESYILL